MDNVMISITLTVVWCHSWRFIELLTRFCNTDKFHNYSSTYRNYISQACNYIYTPNLVLEFLFAEIIRSRKCWWTDIEFITLDIVKPTSRDIDIIYIFCYPWIVYWYIHSIWIHHRDSIRHIKSLPYHLAQIQKSIELKKPNNIIYIFSCSTPSEHGILY